MSFTPLWFQFLIWLDYRLAFIFTVIIPVVLSIWGLRKKVLVVNGLMKIYWRVASLFAITIYLAIGESGLSFFTGWLARLLIPLSLWFWIDINEEIADLPPKAIKLALTTWRWAITAYCAIGLAAWTFPLKCSTSNFCTTACQRALWVVWRSLLSWFTLSAWGTLWWCGWANRVARRLMITRVIW
jgi:hypothetical protein